MNTPPITTEELLALSKSTDLLRQTAEKAMRCDDLARELHNTRNDRDYLAGILEKVARVFDDPDEGPDDFYQLPQAVEGLRLKCESLKGEVVTAGNHAACRLNVLKDIHRTLGSDGGTTGVSDLTGVPPQLYRLPKRIDQLLEDVTTWRERYDMMIAENGELVRENAVVKDAHHAVWKWLQLVEGENETLARNMPPEPPPEPPADTPVVMTYDQASFQTTKILGQAWCRLKPGTYSPSLAVLDMPPNDLMVLCNVHQDTTTGALTYRPVAVKDLPIVP